MVTTKKNEGVSGWRRREINEERFGERAKKCAILELVFN